MKKLSIVVLLFLLLGLVSCGGSTEGVIYSDDEPFIIDLQGDSLKILQLTDLHLLYGIDAYDRKTLNGIKTLVESDTWDMVVITGDMAMSISAPSLFAKLVRFMESLETPWTFIFGNHETDYNDYQDLLSKIKDTEYLYFKVGPELDEGGVGNFRIQFNHAGTPFYTLYLMDSHAEREVYTEDEGEYDYIHASQVEWYNTHVSQDTTNSVMYMHIPLREFMNPDELPYCGTFDEDKVYAQGINTGLFDAIVLNGKTKGVFVGHDHLNDFSFEMDGVLLAYGQITGYNAYGDLERGGRVVEVSSLGVMTSYILLEKGLES